MEQRAVRDSAELAGAREVYLIEEPVAAAIGAALPITEPSGNMVVDVGGGTTDIAVISLGGIVYSESVKVAGDRMDDAIMNYIKKKYNLLIGEHMAERIKFEIGSAYPFEERKTMMIKGRDLISGIPRTLVVDDAEIREALQERSERSSMRSRLRWRTPRLELAGDIIDRGIVLTGGGSLLKGMDTRFREETNLPIITVDDPSDFRRAGSRARSSMSWIYWPRSPSCLRPTPSGKVPSRIHVDGQRGLPTVLGVWR